MQAHTIGCGGPKYLYTLYFTTWCVGDKVCGVSAMASRLRVLLGRDEGLAGLAGVVPRHRRQQDGAERQEDEDDPLLLQRHTDTAT